LIDGLKLIHSIYYNKYNTFKLPDKLKYFVLFDKKGEVITIIDFFKKCDYFWNSENKKLIKLINS
jgi:hypothetical protein